MDHHIAVALGLASANHPLTEETKRRVLAFARTRELDAPFISAALVSKLLSGIGTHEAQSAIDALVDDGQLEPVAGWGYVWAEKAAWGHLLLGRGRK